MKKTLKRALTALIAAALLLSCLPLGTLAATESEYDRLWEEKSNMGITFDYCNHGEESRLGSRFYLPPTTVLLYTEHAKDFTFGVVGEDFEATEMGDYVTYGSVVCAFGFGDGKRLYVKELVEIGKSCYQEYGIEVYPPLYYFVRAFDIDKEELKQAYTKMKTEPESIRELLSCLSDEEFERAVSLSGYGDINHPDWVFDALYLDDEEEARALLCRCCCTYIDGEFFWDDDILWGKYTLEELQEKGILTRSFRCFVKTARAHHAYEYEPPMLSQLEAYLAENPENDPPKAGDPTAAYALIFTLAALPLAGFGVYEWKRRRRAV